MKGSKYFGFFLIFWVLSTAGWVALAVLFLLIGLTGEGNILIAIFSVLFVIIGGYYSFNCWVKNVKGFFLPQWFLIVLTLFSCLMIVGQSQMNDINDLIKAYGLVGWVVLFGALAMINRKKQLLCENQEKIKDLF